MEMWRFLILIWEMRLEYHVDASKSLLHSPRSDTVQLDIDQKHNDELDVITSQWTPATGRAMVTFITTLTSWLLMARRNENKDDLHRPVQHASRVHFTLSA